MFGPKIIKVEDNVVYVDFSGSTHDEETEEQMLASFMEQDADRRKWSRVVVYSIFGFSVLAILFLMFVIICSPI